jgi:hypothetical protein
MQIITRFQCDPVSGQPTEIQVYTAKEIKSGDETFTIASPNPIIISSQSGGKIAEAINNLIEIINIEINQETPTPIIPLPNWGTFSKGLFANNAYNAMRNNPIDIPDAKVARSRLEAIGISLGFGGMLSVDGYGILVTLWNAVIKTTMPEFKPNSEGVNSFIALAKDCNIPIKFQPTGEMVIS